MKRKIRQLTTALLVTSLLWASMPVQTVHAAGFTVNTLDDNTNSGDGFCTLREAIQSANNAGNGDCGADSAGDDTITINLSGEITLGTTLPDIIAGQGTLIIDGGGEVTISGDETVRIFFIDDSASLTLQNLAIINGKVDGDSGGAILNFFGTLNVLNSTFRGNSASNGGAILNAGTLTIANSTFSGNSSVGDGGAINNAGTLTIASTTFNGNTTNNQTGNNGGAIYNAATKTLHISNSTFSENSAYIGGAIQNDGALTVSNSTFSEDTALLGGAIANENGTAEMVNNTFSGGNIYNDSNGTVSLANNIFANSLSGGGCINSGVISTAKNNLVESTGADACNLANNVNGNIIGQAPNLGGLQNNGGITLTHALLPGSPAIDTGDPTTCATTDQRGVHRASSDGNKDGTPRCDIGAFEVAIFTAKSSGAQDGWILESGETTNKGGKLNKGASTLNVGDDAANKQYRTVLSFNTADLPDDAGITKVTLKVRRKSVTGGGNPITIFGGFLVDIKTGNFGKAGLQLADFSTKGTKTIGAFKPKAASGGWYTINLTTGKNFINKFGNTQIRLRFKTDDNNNFIANFLSIHSGNASSASRPQLIVEYDVP